ncbi:hypothetical protein ACJIZ3_005925 [Penstemon smallii]|uniref:RING-type domain-containing protein n=1 Tax=Penstemon smallii TaxID=265156 RepID=A0ABD3S682_9LAMI
MSPAPPPSSHQSLTSDSDYPIVTIFVLFAIACMAILIAFMHCDWIRHLFSYEEEREVFDSIPIFIYGSSGNEYEANLSECSICLDEFATGDELCVLPQCGHGFHVRCIDSWLRKHQSCPNCRQTLVAAP